MSELLLSELVGVANQAVDRASEIVRERGYVAVTQKGDRDPATDIDFAVERELRRFLLEAAPAVGFLGEEEGRFGASDSEITWALDPIDGTVNFMNGVPLCGVSLGLIRGDRPVVGVVDLPFLDSRYTAVIGCGAYRNQERIRARPVSHMEDAVVAVGDFAVGEGAEGKNALRFRVVEDLARTTQRVRMFGSAAVDLVWVAEGRIAASVMLANKPWDTAAGVLVAREAGASVVDMLGDEHTIHSTSTVASAPGLSEILLVHVMRAVSSIQERPS